MWWMRAKVQRRQIPVWREGEDSVDGDRMDPQRQIDPIENVRNEDIG